MHKDFDDLPINIMGSDCGRFSGTAYWNDDGVLDEVIILAESLYAKDVHLTRKPSCHPWFALFAASLELAFADALDQHRATYKARSAATAADTKYNSCDPV